MTTSRVLQNGLHMIWLLLILQEILINNPVFGADEHPSSRSAYVVTRVNKRLPGHVVKSFTPSSLMSCSQSCLKKSWCTSANFKQSFKQSDKGTCELNKDDSAPISESTELVDQRGVTFSVFLKVRFDYAFTVEIYTRFNKQGPVVVESINVVNS